MLRRVLLALLVTLALATFAWAQAPAIPPIVNPQPPSAPAPPVVAPAPSVPAVVAPSPAAKEVPSAPTTGTNLLQWIILGAALMGALIKRINDTEAETKSLRTVMDVAVAGGATYVVMDLASEMGFLQDYMTVLAQKPLTLGVVSFLVSVLAGAGVVAGVQAILDNGTALLKRVSGK